MSQNITNRKPFFKFIKNILRIFKHKPKVINYNEELEDGAIYLTNHCGAQGPLVHELYFPKNFRFLGTFEMVGTFKERWNYLTKIYFTKKKHLPKWLAVFISIFATPVLHGFYKGLNIIPSFPDARLRNTLKTSFEELNNNTSIIIFPENSSDGYHDELKEYFAGFMILAKYYYKTYNKNLKIYNMYYSKKDKLVIIDQAVTYLDLINSGKSNKEIAEDMKNKANELYHKHCNEKK